MARHDFYCQCRLERSTHGGTEIQVAWIPQKIARVGNRVRVRDSGADPWSENWLVKSVGPPEKGELVETRADAHRHHRDVTDI